MTTVNEDINIGVNKVLKELKAMGIDPDKAEYKLACSSAAGGLKMVALGLVPDLTVEAARRAALGAGAKVGQVFCYELTDTELEQIVKYSPDIILLAGGTLMVAIKMSLFTIPESWLNLEAGRSNHSSRQ